ncbi:hypothetical protein NUW58_g7523 [Xylaria curta]|uniref:Uncharacterized protein n=1 Tax=Xylaria curta TaxID=42375 RepID=A0ACC1NIV4_9PEZI|nr:hypothetical protein NUW58_g7523 [Xylaria curta]
MPRRGDSKGAKQRSTPGERVSSTISSYWSRGASASKTRHVNPTVLDQRVRDSPIQAPPFTPARRFHDPSAPTSTRKISASFSTDCPLSGHPTLAYSAVTASTTMNHPGPLTSHPINQSSARSSPQPRRSTDAYTKHRALEISHTYNNLPTPTTQYKARSCKPFVAATPPNTRASSSRNIENIPPSAPVSSLATEKQGSSKCPTPRAAPKRVSPKKKAKSRPGIPKSRTFSVFSNFTASLSRTSLGQLTGSDSRRTSTSSKSTARKDPAPYMNPQSAASTSSQALLNPAVETTNPLQIYTAQSSAYWTGRFMALQDRFQSETLLPENLATLSKRQLKHRADAAPKISRSTTTVASTYPSYEAAATLLVDEDNRSRRIFLHLDALCATSEARVSLQKWQQNYARRMGKENLRMKSLIWSTLEAKNMPLAVVAPDDDADVVGEVADLVVLLVVVEVLEEEARGGEHALRVELPEADLVDDDGGQHGLLRRGGDAVHLLVRVRRQVRDDLVRGDPHVHGPPDRGPRQNPLPCTIPVGLALDNRQLNCTSYNPSIHTHTHATSETHTTAFRLFSPVPFNSFSLAALSLFCTVRIVRMVFGASTRPHFPFPTAPFGTQPEALSTYTLANPKAARPRPRHNPHTQYTLFEQMKNIFEARRKRNITPTMAFFLGALGKLFATSITYPYITVKSQMHVAGNGQKEGMTQAIRRVIKEEGYAGLYKGIGPKVTQSVLTAAFLFAFKDVLYEQTVKLRGTMARKAVKA